MAVMRVVPNPGQSQQEADMSAYGNIGQSNFPQGNPPASLPGSPPFQMPPLDSRYGPAPSYASGQQGVQPVTPPPGLPGPIYPGTWDGKAWHVGPGVKYTGKPDKFAGGKSPMTMYGALGSYGNPEEGGGDFKKFLKFGVIDNALLVAMAVLGANYDKQITTFFKVDEGWGPVFGAGVGNALSDGVAALTDREGGFAGALSAAGGVTVGAILPVIPVYLVAKLMKKSPKDKMGTNILLGTSALLTIWAFTSK